MNWKIFNEFWNYRHVNAIWYWFDISRINQIFFRFFTRFWKIFIEFYLRISNIWFYFNYYFLLILKINVFKRKTIVIRRLIVFSIFDQKFELDSIFLICLDHKLVVLSLVLHNFIKSISKSISWRLETISLD